MIRFPSKYFVPNVQTTDTNVECISYMHTRKFIKESFSSLLLFTRITLNDAIYPQRWVKFRKKKENIENILKKKKQLFRVS